MPLIIGEDNIKSIYVGNQKIGKAYRGGELIYSFGSQIQNPFTYELVTFPKESAWRKIIYFNKNYIISSHFYATSYNFTGLIYSSDLKTFSNTNIDTSQFYNNITVGGSYVVIPGSTDRKIYYSTNGTSFSTKTSAVGTYNTAGMIYAFGKFILLHTNGEVDISSSPNGTWSKYTSSASYTSRPVFFNNYVIAVNITTSEPELYKTTNGTTWNSKKLYGINRILKYSCNNNLFVLLESNTLDNQGIVYTNIDMEEYNRVDLPSIANEDYWVDIAYGDGYFIIVSKNGRLCYSKNGKTWILGENILIDNDVTTLSYANGLFMAFQKIGSTAVVIRFNNSN